MEKENGVYMTPIDVIAGGNSLQLLKALIPYQKKESQMGLALLVKMMEFQNLMNFFKDSGEMSAQDASGEAPSFLEILTEIAPYLPPGQRETIQQLTPMIEIMKLLSSMNEGGNGDQGDFLKNMLSPEQQSLFETYQTMFSQAEDEEGGT